MPADRGIFRVRAQSSTRMSRNRRLAPKKWTVCASGFARNTQNPIREIVDNLKLEPNPAKPMIALSIGDPTVFGNLPPAQEVIDAIHESVDSQKHNGYAPASGYLKAKEAVAKYTSQSGVKVKTEDVVLCNGCSGALEICIMTLANPGQNILVPCPGFSTYRTISESVGINIKTYKLLPNRDWEIDTEDLERQIDFDTVAIVVNNPSNPCGSVYSKKHLCEVLDVASRHRLPIIADEIYEHMIFPGQKYHPLGSLSEDVPVLSCSGLTKRFLIPGWRMGWIVIHDRNNIFQAEIRQGLLNLTTKTLGSCTIVQGALPRILEINLDHFHRQTIQTIQAHAHMAFNIISQIPGLTPIMPQGAMYMMVMVKMDHFPRINSTLEFVEKLVCEESVLCLPGECFGYPGSIRIVLSVPQPLIQEASHRINLFCSRHYDELAEPIHPLHEHYGVLVSVNDGSTSV